MHYGLLCDLPEYLGFFVSSLEARGFWVCHETQWSRHYSGSPCPFQGEAKWPRQRAYLHGPSWDRGQLLPAAIFINEEHDYLETPLGDHKVPSDIMTAQLRACDVCFKQKQRWITPNGKPSSSVAWLKSFYRQKAGL